MCKKSGTSINEPYNLSLPWSGVSIGSPIKEGSATVSNDIITVKSKGKGMNVYTLGDNGSSDQISFVYQNIKATPLQGFSIQTKLRNIGATGGVMIRENSASNAKFVALTAEKGKGLKLVWRDNDNKATNSQVLGTDIPTFIKLEKHGSEYIAYQSQDGINWGQAIGKHKIELTSKIGGVFTASSSNDVGVESTFENTKIQLGEATLSHGKVKELKIMLDNQKFEIGKAATITASVKLEDNQELDVSGEQIIYTSDKPQIAEVNGKGVVTGKAEGSATITAKLSLGGTAVTGTVAVNITQVDKNLLTEDFNSYTDKASMKGWALASVSTGGSSIDLGQMPGASDKCLKVYDNVAGTVTATKAFEAKSDPISVEFDYRVNFGKEKRTGGTIVAYLLDSGGSSAISILGDAKGFWYLDGSTTKVIAPLEEDKLYHIKIVANAKTKKMDMYINNELKVTQGNFRNSVEDLAKVMVGGSTSGLDTTGYWDNFKVLLQ